mgnify:CR=1 FL=1|tara:strand:- start:353 stop:520 length:168 start_codon:yes stop_codon:yes gene_type:complete
MNAEDTLKELGIELGDPIALVGNYIGAVTVGNLVFLSGHGPRETDGPLEGKLGVP